MMAGPVRISILADAAPAVKGMHTVEESASGMGKTLGGIGGSIKGAFAGLGALFAVDKITEGFKQVIDQAAELSAAVGATKQVFGKSAKGMLDWSKGAAVNLGLSQAEALNATKVFGGFFTAVGMSTKESATMSKSWTTMAGNLAAFADLPTADAIDAITGALRGELDPLQKYIPTVSAAAIQQKAMELSGKKNAKALTDQDKAAAINAFLMDSVANKAGKAERAQGGYAVQMEKLKAQMKDGAAALGGLFLPALTKGMAFINTTAIPAVKKFGEIVGPKIKAVFGGISSFKPPKAIVDLATSSQAMSIVTNIKNGFMSLGPVFSRAFAVVMPIIRQVAATLGAAFTKALPQIKSILGTIGQIVGQVFEFIRVRVTQTINVIQFIWKNFGANILGYLSSAFAAVVTILQGAFTVIKGVFDVIIGLLTGDWSRAWDGVKTVIQGVWLVIQGVWQNIVAFLTLVVGVVVKVLGAAWAVIASAAVTAWNWIKGVIAAAWNGIKTGVGAAVNWVKSIVAAAWSGIQAATSAVWNAIRNFFVGIWNGIKAVVGTAVSAVRTAVSAAWSAIQAANAAIWNAIRSAITSVWNGIKSVVSGAAATVRTVISGAWNAVKTATTAAWNAIKGAVATGLATVVSTVKTLPGKVKSAVSGAAGWLVDTGKDMIRGLISGISNMADGVARKAREVVAGAINAAKSVLKIGSPSKVFFDMGVQSMQGYENGFVASSAATSSAISKAISNLTAQVNKGLPKSISKTFPKGTKQSIIDAWKKAEAAAASVRAAKKNALLTRIAKDNATLDRLIAARDDIADKLKDANDHIADLQKQRADVVSGVVDTFAATFKLINDSADEVPASIDDMLQRSRDAVTQAQEFAKQIKALTLRGVDPAILRELAAAGPKAGLDTATALMNASADQLKELGANYKQIATSGAEAGDALAGTMYDTGIAAAQSIADGFAAQQAAMESQMLAVIASLAAKIKKTLAAATGPIFSIITPTLPAVKPPAKKTTTPVKKAAPKKAVAASVSAASVLIPVTVNTGVVVDKRGLVDTISSAFNEVSEQLGRPITMNVR
jgi:phage-related protein